MRRLAEGLAREYDPKAFKARAKANYRVKRRRVKALVQGDRAIQYLLAQGALR